MAQPWVTLASVPTDEGPLKLRKRGEDDFLIVIAGRVLMTSRARRSEEALARLACEALAGRPAPRVLVGGLGMGYTLRAALDALPARAEVVVAELTGAVVAWCQGPLAALTASAVTDPRVRVEVVDVARHIAAARPGSYDAIVLDLYEGPHARNQGPGAPLYGDAALGRTRAALAPGGVVAIWAEERDSRFERRLTAAGFAARTRREGKGGRKHVVYLGVRTR